MWFRMSHRLGGGVVLSGGGAWNRAKFIMACARKRYFHRRSLRNYVNSPDFDFVEYCLVSPVT